VLKLIIRLLFSCYFDAKSSQLLAETSLYLMNFSCNVFGAENNCHFLNLSSRKDSVSGKGKSVTELQSSQKQNSADVNLQDIFSSSCNIARLNPSRKSSTKNVPATAPVVAAARSKSSNKEDKSDR
jgi:hypothetical protein